MNPLKKLWQQLERIPENYLDILLWVVGLTLIAVSIWGEKKHKLWACGYVVF